MDQQQEIARIAYELFLMRGGMPGDPVADWVTAERLYWERQQAQDVRLMEEPVATEPALEANAVTVEVKPAATRARKAAAKKETVSAEKKAPKKAEVKAAPVKEEKKAVEEPAAAKKTTRKKAASKQ